MKGFPNQVVDLGKLTAALRIAAALTAQRKHVKDDAVYGEALVRGQVVAAGRKGLSIEAYLAAQKEKTSSNQSFRTTARGLRELFRVLGLMDDLGLLTAVGNQIARHSGTGVPKDIWRSAILNMRHYGNYGGTSHPYQVLLRLVAKKPGITRAKCALALEAKNDTEEELERIVTLAQMEEEKILNAVGETKCNWDNAKKVLPAFAEQLGDVNKIGDQFYVATTPPPLTKSPAGRAKKRTVDPSGAVRASRKVTPEAIAKAGTVDTFDEDDTAEMVPPEDAAARKRKLAERLKRHNEIVQKIAALLDANGAALYENPFDCLAVFPAVGLLIEVKTLDGTAEDERLRVRDALSQSLYYQAFAVAEHIKAGRRLMKIAIFEKPITPEHVDFLNASNVETLIWRDGGLLAPAAIVEQLRTYFGTAVRAS